MQEKTRSNAELPREEAPSGGGWPFRGRILSIVLSVGAIIVGLTAGLGLASLYLGGGTPGASGFGEEASVAGGGMLEEASAEAGFARDMMVHHAQAVEMAEIVRDKTESDEIRMLAADIALIQQGQIGQMQGWLAVWGLPPTGTEPAMTWMGHSTEGRMPGMASPEDIDNLQKASPQETDTMFLQLMIPHHEAAIPMSEAVLGETDREEVERLAGAIAASQTAEIEMMKGLLNIRGVSVESDSSSHGGGSHGGNSHGGD